MSCNKQGNYTFVLDQNGDETIQLKYSGFNLNGCDLSISVKAEIDDELEIFKLSSEEA